MTAKLHTKLEEAPSDVQGVLAWGVEVTPRQGAGTRDDAGAWVVQTWARPGLEASNSRVGCPCT